MVAVPTKEGFFWGKWCIAADGTADNGEGCNGKEWEVHHVVENCLDTNDPEFLMVMVPGVSQWQPRENFFWGVTPAEVKKPAGIK